MRLLLLASCLIALSTQAAVAQSYLFNTTVPFNASLSCYTCIRNNYIYCVNGTDHQIVNKGQTAASGVCCSSYQSCSAYVKNSNYTCSSSYKNPFLSLRMCPFSVTSCGTADSAVLAKQGLKLSTSVTLQPGQVCVYNLRATCGAPALSVKAANNSGVEVFSIDYDDYDVTT